MSKNPVSFDLAQLGAFAEELAASDLTAPEWREPWYPQEDDATFVEFIGVANALNFCYTEPGEEKFAINVPWFEWPLTGSGGLMGSLRRAREEGIDLLDPEALMRLTIEDVEHIFRSDAGPLPLLDRRLHNLQDVGRRLLKGPYESFSELFAASEYDAESIISELTTRFHSYDGDFGNGARFDKRPRLLPLMYQGRAQTSGGALPTLINPEAIGPVIDYQVAKTLRAKNVLVYSEELDRKIQDGILLPFMGQEEFNIRVHAHGGVEMLLSNINRILRESDREPITMVELDFALWSAGRKLKEIPHHLCMTTAY